MKILVHDYAGHPFQVHLSRQLARLGHQVSHAYFAELPGPKGAFDTLPDDPAGLRFHAVSLGRGYDKASLFARRFTDVAYGRRLGAMIDDMRPDVVISGNTPTEAQAAILRACRRQRAGFVYWLQDFYSIAVSTLVRKRLGWPGAAVGLYYRWLERRQLHTSDAVIAITEDFVPLAATWAGEPEKVSVIENWAALDDIPLAPKDNDWSRRHGLHQTFNFVYSGTLGLKHNPSLLIRLAAQAVPDTGVVAVAEGVGTALLADAQLPALRLLPLQPAVDLHQVLAAGDVLVAMIESDAGHFAVPSKVQSYMCAGRPILLAAPRENLAARTVVREQAGLVVDPGDEAGFLAAAARLRDDPDLCARLGANGRAYAERTFDTVRIADRFEAVLRSAAQRQRRPVPQPEWRLAGARTASRPS